MYTIRLTEESLLDETLRSVLTNKNLENMIESRIIRIENGYEIIGYFLNKVLIKTSRMKVRGWK